MREVARDMGDANLIDPSPGARQVLELTGSGYPPIVSAIVLVALSAACAVFLLRRVTRPVRI